jgi:eukaryotic-like serine/threonine-protein kinase
MPDLLPVLDPKLVVGLFAASGGLLLVFFLFLYKKEQDLSGYREDVELDGKSPAWIEKKAQELIRIEAFRLAGDLKAHQNKYDEAAELYRKGGNLLKAAESHISAGNKKEAAKAFLNSKHYERAASLFIEINDYSSAAEAHVKSGELIQAAETFVRGGAHRRAAEIYTELGLYRQASLIYEQKEHYHRAADVIWRCYGQEKGRLPEDISEKDSMPLHLLAKQAGDLFIKSEQIDQAVEAYNAGGWAMEKAAALCDAKRFPDAALAYSEIGMKLEAADCYEKGGEEIKAAELRAEYNMDKGRPREAVQYFESSGNFEKAAQIHKDFEEWVQAGECYEKARKFNEAAAMFEKGEQFSRAAKALEQAEEFLSAAELFGKAGDETSQAEALEKGKDFLGAGNNYFGRGLLDKAISTLQKLEFSNPGYSEASFVLGQIFKEKGMMELAHEYFNRSIKDQELSRGNLENYYQLAVCDERMNKTSEAAGIYEEILVMDFHFKDVANRLNTIKSNQTIVDTPPGGEFEQTMAQSQSSAKTPKPRQDTRYDLIEEVGRGGMGIVYKSRDTVLERIVAFKMLPSNLKEHPQALKNFFREAKSAAALNHPNIVTVFDAGEEGGSYYIAMEFIEGETIKQILNREGKLPFKAVLMIAGQICKALEYAHEKRIVHRDIKCSNIMWTPDKQVKLMDFGLAKVIEEVKGYQTIASGTPYYMSPEQALGRNIDHRTDLYSLGVTMFEMISGKLPFVKGDAAYHHVHTEPPEAKSMFPEIPGQLNELILKCMQKKPDQRYKDATELFSALRDILKSNI